jgi:hypothetical protein
MASGCSSRIRRINHEPGSLTVSQLWTHRSSYLSAAVVNHKLWAPERKVRSKGRRFCTTLSRVLPLPVASACARTGMRFQQNEEPEAYDGFIRLGAWSAGSKILFSIQTVISSCMSSSIRLEYERFISALKRFRQARTLSLSTINAWRGATAQGELEHERGSNNSWSSFRSRFSSWI